MEARAAVRRRDGAACRLHQQEFTNSCLAAMLGDSEATMLLAMLFAGRTSETLEQLRV